MKKVHVKIIVASKIGCSVSVFSTVVERWKSHGVSSAMSSYADARDYYSYSASSFGDEVDTDPLCCCEYFDRNDERNHILACCCNCVDFDESCDRFVCLDFFAKAKVFGRSPLPPRKELLIGRRGSSLPYIHPTTRMVWYGWLMRLALLVLGRKFWCIGFFVCFIHDLDPEVVWSFVYSSRRSQFTQATSLFSIYSSLTFHR